MKKPNDTTPEMPYEFLVKFPKSDEGEALEKKFETARKRAGIGKGSRADLVRSLLDAWSDAILGRPKGDVQSAAERIADGGKSTK